MEQFPQSNFALYTLVIGFNVNVFMFQLNLWRYGDFTEDDAKEFGYQK